MKFLARALLFLALAAQAHAAEHVFPPGSRIGLVPPPGMAVAKAFQGFEDAARGAMLAVTELSVQSYARAEEEFSDPRMRAGGMEPVARETISLPRGQGELITARQTENGVAMRKWALLTFADDMTVIVIASLPEAAREAYPDAAMRAALASVVARQKLSAEEMRAVLPYRLGDLGGFRLVRASPDGTAVFTLGPADTSLPAEQPYFMMAPRAAEPPAPAERDRFAQRALMTFLNRPDLRIVTSEPVRIAGAAGHEIVARGRDPGTGAELMTVQWLRFGTRGFMQMYGSARKDQWDAVLPRMRALRDGFEPR